MRLLNEISHPNPHIKNKVNFFADYFQFAVRKMGEIDGFEIENELSLILNIIFQIETNVEHCPKYLDVYFEHPLLRDQNIFLDEFKCYKEFNLQIHLYKSIEKSSKKVAFIKSNTAFLQSAKRFEKELRRNMVKKALKSIVSYLKCTHDIEFHKKEITAYTNKIISEFIFTGRPQEYLKGILDKILSINTRTFPFPKSLTSKSSQEEKDHYIKQRTFDQQFLGIYNLFKQKEHYHSFIFRIYNITAKDDFLFKYNNVTFIHPDHTLLINFKKNESENSVFSDFFNSKMVAAIIKVKYYNEKIAQAKAEEQINKELRYLNKVCDSNGFLESHSFLYTTNFRDFGGRWDRKSKTQFITEDKLKILNDNPFRFLKSTSITLKQPIFDSEHLFIEAFKTKDIGTYWRYLELLFKNYNSTIIDLVSTILLLSCEPYNQQMYKNYISDCLENRNYFKPHLSKRKRIEYYNAVNKFWRGKISFKKIPVDQEFPILNHLVSLHDQSISRADYKITKEFYARILLETYAQRNSIIHAGFYNERSIVSLAKTLPILIIRLRRTLFHEISRSSGQTFEQIVDKLKQGGLSLLHE